MNSWVVLSHHCFPELSSTNQCKTKQTDSGKENTGLWQKRCFQGRAIPVPWTCQRTQSVGFGRQSVSNDSINATETSVVSAQTPTPAIWWTVATSPASGQYYTLQWKNAIQLLKRFLNLGLCFWCVINYESRTNTVAETTVSESKRSLESVQDQNCSGYA